AARKGGAEVAEAMLFDGIELTTKVRLGRPELVQEAGSRALGLRVFRDRRTAITYTSDLEPAAMDRFVENTLALALLAQPDELNELVTTEPFAAAPFPELELYDERAVDVTVAQALARATDGEAAARAWPKVTNSKGATFTRIAGAIALVIEGPGGVGFRGGYR